MAGLRLLGALVVAVVIAGARPAVAATDDDPAREAFEQARRAYNLGRWQEAADGFERAYRLLGDPVLLFDRGQALRRAGRPDEAIASYEAYLRERPDAANRAQVEAHIRALELSRPRQGVTPPIPERAEAAPVPADIAAPRAAPAARPSPRRWLPWVGAGVTVALAGSATAMGLSVNHRFAELRDTCGRTVGCSEDQKSDLRTRVTATNVLWALAGVSAVATGISLFVGPREAEVAVAWRF
jgi:tetratricopeptide (TPR) repeat protein